jgi:hypothetical protein
LGKENQAGNGPKEDKPEWNNIKLRGKRNRKAMSNSGQIFILYPEKLPFEQALKILRPANIFTYLQLFHCLHP